MITILLSVNHLEVISSYGNVLIVIMLITLFDFAPHFYLFLDLDLHNPASIIFQMRSFNVIIVILVFF